MENQEKKYSGYGYHGGGRPKSGNTYKKFSVACTHAEYEQIRQAAEKAGKSISRVLVDGVLDQDKYHCQNRFVAMDKDGNAVACYAMYDCSNCHRIGK